MTAARACWAAVMAVDRAVQVQRPVPDVEEVEEIGGVRGAGLETRRRRDQRGRTNAGIASRLYLSEGTVKGVVSRLMTHLDCTNRTQLALLAARGIGWSILLRPSESSQEQFPPQASRASL